MYIYETQIRVRYGETDQMGYAYYGVYPLYFEIGRTDMLRSLGLTYKKMEEEGIMLPVTDLSIKYIKPAFYDDLLTLKTYIRKIPSYRLEFDYELYNPNGELINKGETTLVFIDSASRKVIRAPEHFVNELKTIFKKQ